MQCDIADRCRREREAAAESLAGFEWDGALGGRRDIARAARRQLQPVVAGAAFEIVDHNPDLAGVARRQKARQRHHRYDRVAHNHRAARRAELLRRKGDRHQPQLALEIRHVEGDLRGAVAVELDDSREQRDDAVALVRQAGDRAPRIAVAAAAQHADAIGARVDQPAVEIAQFDAEPALAEIEFLGRRAVELGQLQHRLIDRGERHIRVLIRREPRHFDPDLGRAARPHDIGRAERDRQSARGCIDAEPCHPDRASRAARCGGARPRGRGRLRPIGADQRVDTGAPSGIDRQFDRRAAGRQAERSQRQNAVRCDCQLGLSGKRRLDEQLGRLARLVARLVECRLELVRHIRQRRLHPPADMEAQARLRAACRIRHLPAITPGRQGARQRRQAVRTNVERARFHRLIAPLCAMSPAAIDRIPAVLPVLAQ